MLHIDTFEGMVAWAAHSLLAIPDSEGHDLNQSAMHLGRYHDYVEAAKRKAQQDDTAKTRTTRYGGY